MKSPIKKLQLHKLALWLLISIAFHSCQEEVLPPSNQLYEMLYDDALNGRVQELKYVDGDMKIAFNCDRNLSKRIVPSQNLTWEYLYSEDTIVNQIASQQKLLYVLDESNRVKEYVSKVWDGEKWYVYYKEDWIFNADGKLKEKRIFSKKAEKESYFINREEYKYLKNGQLEISKYGKDQGSKTKNGLLRKETRTPNEKGGWKQIEELDEDGIPYRKAAYNYTYDKKNNWTKIIFTEVNNYTGQTTTDTIQRKITYFQKGKCLKNEE